MPPSTRSGGKRERSKSMDATKDSTIFLNDCVYLPIIISDYDAERRESSSTAQTKGENSAESPSSDSIPQTEKAKWTTGFSEVADELWNRMNRRMKQKLREACVEVLKRTDEPLMSEVADRWGGYDDNTRLLD